MADRRLVSAVQQAPKHLRIPLLATALIESGGRLDAVGDSGRSHGPFQEFDNGRGAGIPVEERRDPVASTARAAREFNQFFRKGLRGGELAFAAQRPADKNGYLRKFRQAVPQARRLLNQGGGNPRGGSRPRRTAGNLVETRRELVPTGQPLLTPQSLGRIQNFITESEQAVLSGQAAGDPFELLGQLELNPQLREQVTRQQIPIGSSERAPLPRGRIPRSRGSQFIGRYRDSKFRLPRIPGVKKIPEGQVPFSPDKGVNLRAVKFDGQLTHPWMAAALSRARRLGWKGRLNSGGRDVHEQTALWNKSDKSGRMVARPGFSYHNWLLASDVSEGDQLAEIAQKHNIPIHRPLSYEGWHFEPKAARGKVG